MTTLSVEYKVPTKCNCCSAMIHAPQSWPAPGIYRLEMPAAEGELRLRDAFSVRYSGKIVEVQALVSEDFGPKSGWMWGPTTMSQGEASRIGGNSWFGGAFWTKAGGRRLPSGDVVSDISFEFPNGALGGNTAGIVQIYNNSRFETGQFVAIPNSHSLVITLTK